MRRLLALCALLTAALLALPAAATAAKPKMTSYRCPDAAGFTCHRINVPLDRTGVVPGTISLRFATESGLKLRKKVLIALAGGPGQPDVVFGPSFADGFAPELDKRSLVVIDQRGTGGSRALSCPELQGMDQLTALLAQDTAACAARLGDQVNSYASIETADDIEAVREALGVENVSIYGVSYGTWVAQQYARIHPDRVDKLILDSVVAPAADPWDTRITRSLPRVLRGLCAGGACRGITDDIAADLTTVVQRIQAAEDRRLTTTIRTPTGGRLRETLSQVDVLYILVTSDVNAFMQARIPAALAAAAHGDLAPLVRLKRDTAGPVTPLEQFSAALFVSTTCLDNELPFSYADPFDVRTQKAAAALAAIPDADIAPFDRRAIDVSSVPQICLHWPNGSFRRESTAPMPDVPTLILSGLADVRTPTEAAEELAKELPRATIVRLRGSGHDAFDADTSGCVDRAVRRFMSGRKVGTPCKGRNVARARTPVPPLSLAAVAPVPGMPAEPGRLLRAAYLTVADTSDSDNQAYYAGFDDTSGAGLRAGIYDSIPGATGQVLGLYGIEFIPDVRVSGAVVIAGDGLDGQVRVEAPGGQSGTVVFFGNKLVARIGGRSYKKTFSHLVRTGRVDLNRRDSAPRLRPSFRVP
jgi:pimeloyl-ACP methyl ester carboxylesterase